MAFRGKNMDVEERKKEWSDSSKASRVKQRKKNNTNWYVIISFLLLVLGGELTDRKSVV